MLVGQLEHGFIGGILWKGRAQERDFVFELFEQVAQVLGYIMVKKELHSRAICRATSRSISPR